MAGTANAERIRDVGPATLPGGAPLLNVLRLTLESGEVVELTPVGVRVTEIPGVVERVIVAIAQEL